MLQALDRRRGVGRQFCMAVPISFEANRKAELEAANLQDNKRRGSFREGDMWRYCQRGFWSTLSSSVGV